MRKKLVVMTMVLMSFCLLSSAFAETTDNLYSNTLLGFSIELPEGWGQKGDMQSGGVIKGRIRLVDEQETMLITIMKGPTSKNFKEEVKSQMNDPGITLEEELQEINLNGREGLKTTVRYFEHNIEVRMLMYFLNTPEADYMINAAPTNPKDFDTLKPVLEKISESIKIIETEEPGLVMEKGSTPFFVK